VASPSALHLAIAAAFAPLNNQEFVSHLTLSGESSIALDFTTAAPSDLGQRISRSLAGIPVNVTNSGVDIDLASLTSRTEVRSVGLHVEEILIASGSKVAELGESPDVDLKKFDPRDRKFLDNVPPHHGV
jgi:hypothetical protein